MATELIDMPCRCFCGARHGLGICLGEADAMVVLEPAADLREQCGLPGAVEVPMCVACATAPRRSAGD